MCAHLWILCLKPWVAYVTSGYSSARLCSSSHPDWSGGGERRAIKALWSPTVEVRSEHALSAAINHLCANDQVTFWKKERKCSLLSRCARHMWIGKSHSKQMCRYYWGVLLPKYMGVGLVWLNYGSQVCFVSSLTFFFLHEWVIMWANILHMFNFGTRLPLLNPGVARVWEHTCDGSYLPPL